jgi:hypothetical protein
LVFNLDGTLVETEKLKALFYARAATELSPDLNEGEVVAAFEDFVGLSRQERRPSPSPPISPAASSATQTSWTALSRRRPPVPYQRWCSA